MRAKIGLTVAKVLSEIGVTGPLRKHAISLLAREESYLRKNSLLEWISAGVGQWIEDVAIYAGSDSPKRKITVLAIGRTQCSDMVVKIGDTEQGAGAIARESEALRRLVSTPLRAHVPELIFEGDFHCYSVQVQSRLNDSKNRQSRRLTRSHLDFLVGLSRLNRTRRRLRDVQAWQKIKLALNGNNVIDVPLALRGHVQYVLSHSVAEKAVTTHTTHGDFTPWNIVAGRDEFSVFDWEESQPQGLPFLDCFHFLYRQAALVGPWPGGQRLVKNMLHHASALAVAAGLPDDLIHPVLHLWVTWEFLGRPCSRITEVATHIRTNE